MTVVPEVGETFGHFRIGQVLGRGRSGSVFEATDTRQNRQVALKVLPPRLSGDEEFTSRFIEAADALTGLHSRHVVRVYEHGRIGECLYLSMQLVQGGDLARYLQHHGPLPQDQALAVVVGVCEALADAHGIGVVHGDVTAADVLIRPEQNRWYPYLCGFAVGHAGRLIQAEAYRRPDLRRVRADERDDIRSVACLLYETVTGTSPYPDGDAPDPMALDARIPALPRTVPNAAALNQILSRATATDPAQRYRTVGELGTALTALDPIALPTGAHAEAAPASEDGSERVWDRATVSDTRQPLPAWMSTTSAPAADPPEIAGEPEATDEFWTERTVMREAQTTTLVRPPAPPSGSTASRANGTGRKRLPGSLPRRSHSWLSCPAWRSGSSHPAGAPRAHRRQHPS